MHNHVLIAEDDKDIVELLKLYLESNGFIVFVSYDGLEALSKLDEDIDIVIADLILVMNNGNIIEQGNHEELMKQNGFYAELYNSQFKL